MQESEQVLRTTTNGFKITRPGAVASDPRSKLKSPLIRPAIPVILQDPVVNIRITSHSTHRTRGGSHSNESVESGNVRHRPQSNNDSRVEDNQQNYPGSGRGRGGHRNSNNDSRVQDIQGRGGFQQNSNDSRENNQRNTQGSRRGRGGLPQSNGRPDQREIQPDLNQDRRQIPFNTQTNTLESQTAEYQDPFAQRHPFVQFNRGEQRQQQPRNQPRRISQEQNFTDPFEQQNRQRNTTQSRKLFEPNQDRRKSRDDNRGNRNRRNEIYEEYWDDEKVADALKNGTCYEGTIRINKRDFNDAYVTVSSLENDIFIFGNRTRNRALEGDVVIVTLLSGDQLKNETSRKQERLDRNRQDQINRMRKCEVEGTDNFVEEEDPKGTFVLI